MLTTIIKQTRIGFHDAHDDSLEQFSRSFPTGPFEGSNGLIQQAVSTAQVAQVRMLMRSFVTWLRDRYQTTKWFIDGYFDENKFKAELAALPGAYAPPSGRLFLATWSGKPAGCVALRKIGENSSEMKRLFVASEFQGKKIGKKLVRALIDEAKLIGYRRIFLDTGYKQVEAQNLYRSLGFVEIRPYYEVPHAIRDMLVFMELKL